MPQQHPPGPARLTGLPQHPRDAARSGEAFGDCGQPTLATAKLMSAASAMPRRVNSARCLLEDQPIMSLGYRSRRCKRKRLAELASICYGAVDRLRELVLASVRTGG